ncbi:MAG: tetratricopeptide repeat protein [Terriglobales bacterium]
MKSTVKLLTLVAVGVLVLGAAGCSKLKARDQLNRGVAAFKSAQFNQAIQNFQTAIRLDPTLVNAKLYLATAYQSQFIPGAPSEDNMHMAEQAMNEYKVVLDQDPSNANAVAGIARLNYDMGDLEGARDYYTKLLSISPNDPSAYYTLGAIDYQETHRGIELARKTLGVTDLNAPLIGKKHTRDQLSQCTTLSQQDGSKVEDGIQQLQKALELRPGYADAMTYLNLLYRDKGDLSCGNTAEYQADVATANKYAADEIAARKAEVAAQNKKNTGGVVINPPKSNQ